MPLQFDIGFVVGKKVTLNYVSTRHQSCFVLRFVCKDASLPFILTFINLVIHVSKRCFMKEINVSNIEKNSPPSLSLSLPPLSTHIFQLE